MNSIAFQPGQIITCDFRKAHGHVGIILPANYLLAWRGTLFDPDGTCTQERLDAHIQRLCQQHKDPFTPSVPVAWSFGHVYWENTSSILPTTLKFHANLPDSLYVSPRSPEYKDLGYEEWYNIYKWIDEEKLLWKTYSLIQRKHVTVCAKGNPHLHDLRFLNDSTEQEKFRQSPPQNFELAA
jgi:hypothetical protein